MKSYLYRYLILEELLNNDLKILVEGNLRCVNHMTEVFLKEVKKLGFHVPLLKDIINKDKENINNDYSNYIEVEKNGVIISVRISDHELSNNSKQNRTNAQIYITSDSFNYDKIQEGIKKLQEIYEKIPNFQIKVLERINFTFIKEYLLLSEQNNNDNFNKLLLKYNISPIAKTFDWFKKDLKNKCQKFVEQNPEYKEKYKISGIYYYTGNNFQNIIF